MNDRREDRAFAVDDSPRDPEVAFDEWQLLVVSNRQPYRHTRSADGESSVDRPTGGLTASLDPMMQHVGGTWVAWGDGDADAAHVDDDQRVAVPPEDPSYTLRRVWLSDEQVEGHYYGFSNRVLWPLCHSSLATIRSKHSYWEQYRRTNEQFAEVVSDEATDQSIIWIQDYHFGLAPSYIRERLGAAPLLMHFWHIPWPPRDLFRACPHGRELLQGLLANDVLCFHAGRYCRNFLGAVDAELDDATINWHTGTVSYRGSRTRVKAIPMGVPFEKVERVAKTFGNEEFAALKRSYGIDDDTTVAVGVDRLDYSKGIPERLHALEVFLERYPERRGSVTHLLAGTESRSRIPAYQRLQDRVSDGIDRVNERFGTDDWQPVVEITEYLSQRELYGLYRHADVCLVTPICDGLNLIAQEYAAAQVATDGVLVLSEQAGVHDLLGDAAVSVPPYDPGEIADRLEEALTMSRPERRGRMSRMRRTVGENDLETWIGKNATVALETVDERELFPNWM
jgi:trehalose 6-phosphate synthase